MRFRDWDILAGYGKPICLTLSGWRYVYVRRAGARGQRGERRWAGNGGIGDWGVRIISPRAVYGYGVPGGYGCLRFLYVFKRVGANEDLILPV